MWHQKFELFDLVHRCNTRYNAIIWKAKNKMKISIWHRLWMWWRRLFSRKKKNGTKEDKRYGQSREPKPNAAFNFWVFIHIFFPSANSCLIQWGQPSLESLALSAVLKKSKKTSQKKRWKIQQKMQSVHVWQQEVRRLHAAKSENVAKYSWLGWNNLCVSPSTPASIWLTWSTLSTGAPAAITSHLTLPLPHGSLSARIIGPTWAHSDGLLLEQQLGGTLPHGETARTYCCHHTRTVFWCTNSRVFPSSQQTEQGVWRSNQRCLQVHSETSGCGQILWYCNVEFLFRQLSSLGLNHLLCFSSSKCQFYCHKFLDAGDRSSSSQHLLAEPAASPWKPVPRQNREHSHRGPVVSGRAAAKDLLDLLLSFDSFFYYGFSFAH